MSGLPTPGPNNAVFLDVVTDVNGYVTGLRRADGTVASLAAPPPVVPTQATISNGVLTLTATSTTLTNGQTIPAGNVIGPTGPANTSNTLAYQRAAGGSTAIQMNAGMAVLYITGTALIVAQTVKLPPTPTDGQFVRISTQQPITLLTVQDASGNAVGTAFALAVLSTGGLYQYQSNAWVKIA